MISMVWTQSPRWLSKMLMFKWPLSLVTRPMCENFKLQLLGLHQPTLAVTVTFNTKRKEQLLSEEKYLIWLKTSIKFAIYLQHLQHMQKISTKENSQFAINMCNVCFSSHTSQSSDRSSRVCLREKETDDLYCYYHHFSHTPDKWYPIDANLHIKPYSLNANP